MTDFLSRGSSSSINSRDMVARKEAIMNNVKQELAVANAQELMNKAGERCFDRCVTKPGGSLSNSEQACLSRCFERYMEAFNIISRTYLSRLGKERLERQGSTLDTSF